jgi:hypothetical protein
MVVEKIRTLNKRKTAVTKAQVKITICKKSGTLNSKHKRDTCNNKLETNLFLAVESEKWPLPESRAVGGEELEGSVEEACIYIYGTKILF